jgi:endonuclease/exonuclease/phosphatase family metal-dependent hydrolase
MKKIAHSIIMSLFFGFTAYSQNLNIMTFNIRLNTKSDGINQWDNRKEILSSVLEFQDIDICGMQEAFIGQILDIKSNLSEYDYIGVGRDDGKEAGEFSPLFYKKGRFKLLKYDTFWLSETPNAPSKGWDASYNRVVTWAKFKDLFSNTEFYVFNTHFDHKGEIARRESAKLLIAKVQEISNNLPSIILGDFNSNLEDEPYLLLNQAFKNTKNLSLTKHFGPNSTFNGFDSKEQKDREIDHIFCNNSAVKILKHGTLSQTWEGRFASDHHAVMVSIKVK